MSDCKCKCKTNGKDGLTLIAASVIEDLAGISCDWCVDAESRIAAADVIVGMYVDLVDKGELVLGDINLDLRKLKKDAQEAKEELWDDDLDIKVGGTE